MKPYLTEGAIYRAESVRYDRELGKTMVTIHDDSGTSWEFTAASGHVPRPGWGVAIVSGWAEVSQASDTPARLITHPHLKRPAAKIRQVMVDDTPDRNPPPPEDEPVNGFLVGGGLLLFIGICLMGIGFFASPGVTATAGNFSMEVANASLMNEKTNYLIIGGVLSICGTLLCITGRKK